MKTSLFLFTTLLLFLLLSCSDDTVDPNNAINYPSNEWIRVNDNLLVDGLNRQIQFRGVNSRVRGIFDVDLGPDRIPLEPIPALEIEDFEEMLKTGFNFFRLPINWSGLEPIEGQFSQSYIDEIKRVVDICEQLEIYVLIDFHQDAYSKEIGEDGAPLWAIYPPLDSSELLEGPLTVAEMESRRFSPLALNASKHFFNNRENIQDRFLPAWKKIISTFKDNPYVIGFEVMNEPLCVYTGLPLTRLYSFYEKCAAAMEEIDPYHTLWLEPDVSRNQLDYAAMRSHPFPHNNVVYCPHYYPLFNAPDASDYNSSYNAMKASVRRMVNEGESWGNAAIFLNEWGTRSDVSPNYMWAMQDVCDELNVGHALWNWKECSQGFWGFYECLDVETANNWTRRENSFKTVARPYAQVIPGRLNAHFFDNDLNQLSFSFENNGETGELIIFASSYWFDNDIEVYINNVQVEYRIDNYNRIYIEKNWDSFSDVIVQTL